MNYRIDTIEPFSKQLRRLVRKYPSLKTEMLQLGKLLLARVITHIYVHGQIIYLLAIYDKWEEESIYPKQILALMKMIK